MTVPCGRLASTMRLGHSPEAASGSVMAWALRLVSLPAVSRRTPLSSRVPTKLACASALIVSVKCASLTQRPAQARR